MKLILFLNLLFIQQNKTSDPDSKYLWDKERIKKFVNSSMATPTEEIFYITCSKNSYQKTDSKETINKKKKTIEALINSPEKDENWNKLIFMKSVLGINTWKYIGNNKIEPM